MLTWCRRPCYCRVKSGLRLANRISAKREGESTIHTIPRRHKPPSHSFHHRGITDSAPSRGTNQRAADSAPHPRPPPWTEEHTGSWQQWAGVSKVRQVGHMSCPCEQAGNKSSCRDRASLYSCMAADGMMPPREGKNTSPRKRGRVGVQGVRYETLGSSTPFTRHRVH